MPDQDDQIPNEIRGIAPIGVVHSRVTVPKEMPRGGVEATIELDPRYEGGLLRIDEHSHLWVLSWFHLSDRETLQVQPFKLDPNAARYGVFGLRANRRPNPIAVSLVELVKVDGNVLHVNGLDAVDGTPILDIKAYFERDCVFSPKAPVLRPAERDTRWTDLVRLARQHHQETCAGLYMGARMSLIAEERVGKLTSPDLIVSVQGPRCLRHHPGTDARPLLQPRSLLLCRQARPGDDHLGDARAAADHHRASGGGRLAPRRRDR